MTKDEFMRRAQIDVLSNGDFNIINYVYTWHPLIDDERGKDQVAGLFNYFGMDIFYEMRQRADEVYRLRHEKVN